MSESSIGRPTRRGFLKNTAVLAGAMPLMPQLGLASGRDASSASETTSAAAASYYRVLNPGEAAFTEAMVNALCPADHRSADGVTCGLATLIDRQLAGAFDTGSEGVVREAQAHLFKTGIEAANSACQERFGTRFDRLSPADARLFLDDIAADRVSAPGFSLAAWSSEVVTPLLTQACFSGTVYDTYANRVFWKVFVNPTPISVA